MAFISPERLALGPWPALERAIARLLEHSGFKNVSLVGGAGDLGADVVGTFKDENWVVQVKFRRSGGADSSGPKEAVKAASKYDAMHSVGATNSHFTKDAFDYWKKTKLNGINLNLWDGDTLLKYFHQLPMWSNKKHELRAYQSQAVDMVETSRSEGEIRALIVMATGLGKSMVAATLMENEFERNPDQEVLVLAHTRDLVRQLESSCWSQLKKERATHLWTDGEEPAFSGGVVFATWQSVSSALKQGENLMGKYGLVIVDEAHHAPASSFRSLLDGLNPNFLIGLTATPWRGDEASLESVFGPVTFSMDIVDGMQHGYLCDVDYKMLTDGIDWDHIAKLSTQGLTVKDLNVHLLLPDRDLAMADRIAQCFSTVKNGKALGFCKSITHASNMQPLLSSKGIRTAIVHSKLPREQRFSNLAAFRRGDIDMLLSVEMLNEGIDVPDVNIVAFMRVTHSRRIFVQQLGRGLRTSQGKTKVTVLDFVADIRRIAACIQLNREAESRSKSKEVVRFTDGQIVKFDDPNILPFFDAYLADVADIENYEDGSRLRYPDV